MVINQSEGKVLQLDCHILVSEIDIVGHFQIKRGEIQNCLDTGLDYIIDYVLSHRRRHRNHHHFDTVLLQLFFHIPDVGDFNPLVVLADFTLIVVKDFDNIEPLSLELFVTY